jgi:endonuclease/exonuclease/phosphatase (EEP) superfamily protein YafD
MFAGRAVSSYAVLGRNVGLTHPVSGRQIDYVHASRKDVRQERIRFLDQRTIAGLNSDHRPLLVRFALS